MSTIVNRVIQKKPVFPSTPPLTVTKVLVPRVGSYPWTQTGWSKSRKIKASRPKTYVSAWESSSRVVLPLEFILELRSIM